MPATRPSCCKSTRKWSGCNWSPRTSACTAKSAAPCFRAQRPGCLVPGATGRWSAGWTGGQRQPLRQADQEAADDSRWWPKSTRPRSPRTTGIDYETDFKAPADESKVNVLACSPTLEMGIDVGGLDAVVMRNIPPRPDNYAQRGGRAGRRSRVGLVLGYARSTPHDQYFYDKPREMIAGEVPAPAVSLGNRDVIVRHLYAIVFGAAEPGLGGPDGGVRAAKRRNQSGGGGCPDRRRQSPVRACAGRRPAGVGCGRAGQGRPGRCPAPGDSWTGCPDGFRMSWTAPPGRCWSCGSPWSRSPRGCKRDSRPCGRGC